MLLKASFSKRSSLTRATVAVALGLISRSGPASEIALIGPIESVDCKASAIEILGVRLVGTDANTSKLICGLQSSTQAGLASIKGEVDVAGVVQLKSVQLLPRAMYVEGATTVYVRGEVSEVSSALGIASISGASFDAAFDIPLVGSVLEVAGTQPIRGGSIVPAALHVIRPPQATGANSSLPSFSTNSSIGSGSSVNNPVGSGVVANSSIGSGIALNSSIGSGVARNSSIGSGVARNSSIGSGIALNSSIGSGAALNSSIGSGVVANSSIGSGIALNSSIGSGVAINSSIGSGVTANSSIGSGIALNSSIGSGVTSKSSIGSGAALNSSIGSGVALNSSIGSGVVLNSSIGSGAVANSSIGSGVARNSSIGSGVARNSSIGSGLQ
jgi:hypothetical protein